VTTTKNKTLADIFQKIVIDERLQSNLPGVAAALVRPGMSPIIVCRGDAVIDSIVPVTPHTVFPIGELSEIFTITALMQLWEEDIFDLDTPVNRLFRQDCVVTPPGTSAISVRNLLTHTAGIGEELFQRPPRPSSLLAAFSALLRTRQNSSKTQTTLTSPFPGTRTPTRAVLPPGIQWTHSRRASCLIGNLLEELSGSPLPAFLQQAIWGPLGLEDTACAPIHKLQGHLAMGYDLTRHGKRTLIRRQFSPGSTSQSLFSSVHDLSRYAETLLTNTAEPFRTELALRPDQVRLLRAKTLEKMFQTQFSMHPSLPAAGLGFWLSHLGPYRLISQGGNTPGFSSAMLLVPEADLGVVVLTNQSMPPSAFFGAEHIGRQVLYAMLHLENPTNHIPARATSAERPDLWDDFTGTYTPDPVPTASMRAQQLFGGRIHISSKNGFLQAHSPIGLFRQGLCLSPTDSQDPHLFTSICKNVSVPFVFEQDSRGTIESLHIGMLPCPFTLRKKQAHPQKLFRINIKKGLSYLTAGAIGTLATRRMFRQK